MSQTLSITNFCQRNESNFVDVISTFYRTGICTDFQILVDFIRDKNSLQENMRAKGNQKFANSLSKSTRS